MFHLRTQFIIVIIILQHCIFVKYLNLLRIFSYQVERGANNRKSRFTFSLCSRDISADDLSHSSVSSSEHHVVPLFQDAQSVQQNKCETAGKFAIVNKTCITLQT